MKPLDPRLLKYASAAKRYIVELTFIAVCVAVLTVLQAWSISQAVSPVISDNQSLRDSLSMIGILLLVVVVRAGCKGLRTLRGHHAAAEAVTQLRSQVFTKAARLGPRWRSQNGANTATLLTRGLDDLDPYFVDYLPQLLATAIVTPIVLVTILWLDFWSALVALVAVPLIPIFMALVGRFTQGFASKRLKTMEQLGTQLLELITGLPTLRALGREQSPRQHLKNISRQNTRVTLTALRVAFLSGGVLEFISTLSVALVAVEVGMRMVYGHLSLAVGLLIIMLAPEVFDPLRQVGSHFHASANGVAAANAAFEILETPLPQTGTQVVPDSEKFPIEIEDLWVASRGKWAPAGLSAQIQPGTIAALVGASGAGKTTTTQVLLGFERATKGTIRLAGIPIEDIDLESWWRRVSWVPQFPILSPGSVRDNLCENGDYTDEEILSAAQLTGFDVDLSTQIGLEGVGLSVGQRQRLALTKALLDRPDYLVLDEPTAHLDASLEQQVISVLSRLRELGCTIIVIAHRNAVTNMADQVIKVSSATMSDQEVATYAPTSTADSLENKAENQTEAQIENKTEDQENQAENEVEEQAEDKTKNEAEDEPENEVEDETENKDKDERPVNTVTDAKEAK